MRLPGIGEALSNRIIERRPFRKIEELTEIRGISEAGMERLRNFVTVEGKR